MKYEEVFCYLILPIDKVTMYDLQHKVCDNNIYFVDQIKRIPGIWFNPGIVKAVKIPTPGPWELHHVGVPYLQSNKYCM